MQLPTLLIESRLRNDKPDSIFFRSQITSTEAAGYFDVLLLLLVLVVGSESTTTGTCTQYVSFGSKCVVIYVRASSTEPAGYMLLARSETASCQCPVRQYVCETAVAFCFTLHYLFLLHT